jgi:hypothetical protein
MQCSVCDSWRLSAAPLQSTKVKTLFSFQKAGRKSGLIDFGLFRPPKVVNFPFNWQNAHLGIENAMHPAAWGA